MFISIKISYDLYDFAARFKAETIHNVNVTTSKLEEEIRYTGKVVELISASVMGAYKADKSSYWLFEYLEKFSYAANQSSDFSNFGLTNRDHDIIASLRPYNQGDKYSLRNREYLQLAMENPGKAVVGKPVYGKISNIYTLPIAVGITDKHNQYQGAAIACLTIEKMAQKITANQLGEALNNVKIFPADDKYTDGSFDVYQISYFNILTKLFSGGGDTLSVYKTINEAPIALLFNYNANIIRNDLYSIVASDLLFCVLSYISIMFLLFTAMCALSGPLQAIMDSVRTFEVKHQKYFKYFGLELSSEENSSELVAAIRTLKILREIAETPDIELEALRIERFLHSNQQ